MNDSSQSCLEPAVLLIDDDALTRRLVSKGLTNAGMTVIQASSGDHGLQELDRNEVDLILLDVHMPGMNGFEVLQAVHRRSDDLAIPVIMLTADDDPAAIETAFEHGATDFITKPINLRLLEQRIRYAMASHAREQRLQQLQAEQTSACQIARIGFWRMSRTSAVLEWSESAAELLERHRALPASLAELVTEIHPDDRLRLQKAFDAGVNSAHPFDLEVRIHAEEHERIVRLSSPGMSEGETLVGSFQDVTSLRRLENQVLYLAEHDELTGLPKQRLFSRLLEELIKKSDPRRVLLFLICIDPILKLTEHFGSHSTRKGIMTISDRLHSSGLGSTVLGRIEDGVFGLALAISDDQAETLALDFHEHLSQPMMIGDREVAPKLILGGAVSPDDAHNADDLIKAAKLAGRSAEENRREGPWLYSTESERDYGSRLTLEADLRIACRDAQFFLVYQPQIDIHTGNLIGAEALLRWRHPRRGVVSPAEFIPLLEETGLIENAGDWALEQTIRDTACIRSEGYSLNTGVNLSPLQLRSECLPHKLTELCARHDLPHHRLDLEITEGAAMHDPLETQILLKRLKSLGFRLSVDDFGTGHSSLSYITDFPIDTIKIDRSFVCNITEGRKQRAIVTAITALSNQLGLTTIAEGIETERQRDYVDALGVQQIQGFLISRPLPLDEFFHFLTRHGSYRQTATESER